MDIQEVLRETHRRARTGGRFSLEEAGVTSDDIKDARPRVAAMLRGDGEDPDTLPNDFLDMVIAGVLQKETTLRAFAAMFQQTATPAENRWDSVRRCGCEPGPTRFLCPACGWESCVACAPDRCPTCHLEKAKNSS